MNGCIKSLSFLISILNFRATIYYGMLLTTITNGVLKTLKKSGNTSPAFIKASVYLLVAWLCPHGLKPENLMREWAAQGKLFSFHVEKAQNQANKHLLIFSQ